MKNQNTNNHPEASGTGTKMGRPTKLNTKVIKAFKEVLAEGHNAIVCTDEEIFFLLNLKLSEEEQISYRSFQRYKHRALKDDEAESKSAILKELYILFRKAMIKQKNNLYNMMTQAKQGWTRFQWIMERKFKDWNAKFMGEVEEKVPWQPPVSLVIPVIRYELMGTLKCVEDKPLITMNEWHAKWGGDIDQYE